MSESTSLINSSTLMLSLARRNISSQFEVYYQIEKYLSILPIFLVISGTLGNLIACYVLTRKKLRVQSTMVYFASLTIIDTISLYQWNFNLFFKYQLSGQDENLENQSMFLCYYISYMAHFSMQTSAWILAIISIDRYLIVTNNMWKQKYSRNIKFNLSVVFLVGGIIGAINLPVALTNGSYPHVKVKYDKDQNIVFLQGNFRRQVICYSTWFYKNVFIWFALLFECIVPLSLMIVFNFLLIAKTRESSIKFKSKSMAVNQELLDNKNRSSSEHKTILKSISMNSSIFKKRTISTGNLQDIDSTKSKNNESGDNSISASYSKLPTTGAYSTDFNNTSLTFTRKFGNLKQAHSFTHLPSNAQARHNTTTASKKLKFTASKQSLTSPNLFNRSLKETKSDNVIQFQPLKNRYLSALSINNLNSSKNSDKVIRKKSSASSTVISDRNFRNRHIVVMLSLLTLSFAVSTVPSSLFYIVIRPLVKDKPYKRLLTNSFTLLRHLSHSFNFIIYFTSSSVIKQQLNEILANLERKTNIIKFLKRWCCCLVCVFDSKLKRRTASVSKQSVNSGLINACSDRNSRHRQSSLNNQIENCTQINCSSNNFEQINENTSVLELNFYPRKQSRIRAYGNEKVNYMETNDVVQVTETVVISEEKFNLNGSKNLRNVFYL